MTGSTRDFEEFVTARGPRLLRVAWLLTGDAHLAEDLLQTVLAKVWPKWPRIADENPEAYVRKALVNTSASWRQRRWRSEVPHDDLPEVTAADVFAAVDLEHSLALAVRRLAGPAAGGDRAAVLRGSERRGDGEGAGLPTRHGQEPGRQGDACAARAVGGADGFARVRTGAFPGTGTGREG